MGYKSDIEIAQSITPEHILKIAERAGLLLRLPAKERPLLLSVYPTDLKR